MEFLSGTHETQTGQYIAHWFGRIVGKPQFGPYAALGWAEQGQIQTAAIFNDFNGANIELHLVGRLSRQVIRDGLRYAFVQLGVQRVTAKPYRSNHPLRNVLIRMGFQQEGVMKNYFGPRPEHDAFVFRLDRDAAQKWIN